MEDIEYQKLDQEFSRLPHNIFVQRGSFICGRCNNLSSRPYADEEGHWCERCCYDYNRYDHERRRRLRPSGWIQRSSPNINAFQKPKIKKKGFWDEFFS
jgi:hypothetical protein